MSIQNVRGMRDLFGQDAQIFDRLHEIATTMAQQYGFQSLHLPVVEHTDLFIRNLGEESDIVSKEIYAFQSKGGDQLALRPEFTAGASRFFVQNGLYKKPMPQKFFSFGPLFRYDRPQKGRYRQFHQFNFEIFGSDEGYKYEVFTLFFVAELLKKMGAQIGHGWTLKLNFLGDQSIRQEYKSTLVEGLNKRKDELSDDSKRRLQTNPLRILDSKDPTDIAILAQMPTIDRFYTPDYQRSVDNILACLNGNSAGNAGGGSGLSNLEGFKLDYKVDPFLVRGMDYYDGMVFEVCPSNGDASQGSILGGGKYARLVKDISEGAANVSAIGFAGGVERLMEVYKAAGFADGARKSIYLVGWNEQTSQILSWSTILAQLENVDIEIALKDYGFAADQEGAKEGAQEGGKEEIRKKEKKALNDATKRGHFDMIISFFGPHPTMKVIKGPKGANGTNGGQSHEGNEGREGNEVGHEASSSDHNDWISLNNITDKEALQKEVKKILFGR